MLLELDNIKTYYGNIRALKGISIGVEEGEIVCLIGANGAGKSTTLMTISGVLIPIEGDVLYRGRSIAGARADNIVHLGICQVPEGRMIFPLLTVSENLDMGAYLRKDREGIQEDMDRVYDLFPVLKERRKQHGGTLSGGEQQMLAIGRALMSGPELLLLDCPTLGLAPRLVKKVIKAIAELKERGVTILMIDQNLHQVVNIIDRGYVMKEGQVIKEDDPKELLTSEESSKAYFDNQQ